MKIKKAMIFSLIALALTLSACAPAVTSDNTMPMSDDPMVTATPGSMMADNPEVANVTSWSKAKATQEIRSLMGKGYLVEKGEGVSKGGRKPRLLYINYELGYIAGIDIGATSMDLVLADVSGKALQRRSEPADVRQPPDVVLGYKLQNLPITYTLAFRWLEGHSRSNGYALPGL